MGKMELIQNTQKLGQQFVFCPLLFPTSVGSSSDYEVASKVNSHFWLESPSAQSATCIERLSRHPASVAIVTGWWAWWHGEMRYGFSTSQISAHYCPVYLGYLSTWVVFTFSHTAKANKPLTLTRTSFPHRQTRKVVPKDPRPWRAPELQRLIGVSLFAWIMEYLGTIRRGITSVG